MKMRLIATYCGQFFFSNAVGITNWDFAVFYLGFFLFFFFLIFKIYIYIDIYIYMLSIELENQDPLRTRIKKV